MSVKLSSVSSVHLLAQPPEVGWHRDAPPALVVDPQHDDAEDGGGRGEDHHRGVVDTEDGRVVSGRDPAGHRHQEHRHVQHSGDAKRNLKIFHCWQKIFEEFTASPSPRTRRG